MLAVFLAGMAVVYVPTMCTTAALVISVLRTPPGRDQYRQHPVWGSVFAAAAVFAWPVFIPYILLTDTEKPT